MDLISGYCQIPIEEEDQQKCVFITLEGLYQPVRMPQGLANTLATFQRLTDNAYRSLKTSCILVYLKIINIFSKNFQKLYLRPLISILKLREVGLKLNLKKCTFCKDKLEFLTYSYSRSLSNAVKTQGSTLR